MDKCNERGEGEMPSWLKTQLTRAFQDKDKRSIVMLNRVFYKYRRNLKSQGTALKGDHSK
jgi:hypothetical protein